MDELTSLLIPTDDGVRLVYGVASAANTVAVRGAATAVELPAIIPVVSGDYCAVLESGADRVIVGPVGGPAIQTGQTPLALDGSGRGTITFDQAFSATPVIVVSVTLNTATTMTAHVVSKTASAFDVQVDSDGTAAASVTRQVNWIAVGAY